MKRYIRSTQSNTAQPAKKLKNNEQRAGYESAKAIMKQFPKAMRVLAQ